MDREAYAKRQRARRAEMERTEVEQVLGKLDTYLEHANRAGMLRASVPIEGWELRGLVNAARENAALRRERDEMLAAIDKAYKELDSADEYGTRSMYPAFLKALKALEPIALAAPDTEAGKDG